jgi:CelD/BcsL family acetyltransferase involved in cellulose biosynthesis
MKLEVVRDIHGVAAIRESWGQLAQQDRRDGFFRTPEWYEAWMRHIRPDAEPFVVVARDSAGDIVGIAPFCRLTYQDLGFRVTSLSFAGREAVSGDFLDFVATNKVRTEFADVLGPFLWDLRSEWGLLVAGELIQGGSSQQSLENFGQNTGLRLRTQEERLCPYIALPSTFDEYLATLSSSTRYHIRRRTRDLLEKQKAEIHVYSEPQEIVSGIETLMQLHVARWQRDHQPGTLGRPGFLDFLRDICGNPSAYASSKLYTMVHDSRPVAALLMFFFGDSALYYQAGWDPDAAVAGQSPGVVLMARTIRDAAEGGFKYYEFLRGDESYKSRWTTTYRTTNTLLCARSLMGRQYLRVCDWKDVAKRRFTATAGSAESPTGQLVESE